MVDLSECWLLSTEVTMIPLQSPRLALKSVSPTKRAVRAQAPTLATLANTSYRPQSLHCRIPIQYDHGPASESTIHSHPNSHIYSHSKIELDQSLHEASS